MAEFTSFVRAPPAVPIWRSLLRRKWLLGLVAIAFLIGVYWLIGLTHDPLSELETATVARGSIEETVTALGKIEPSRYVDVGAQASGQLKHIWVQPGDIVHQGQLLAEIDPQLQAAKVEADKAQLAQLKANLQAAIAQSEYAAAEYHRQTRLFDANATSRDVFEESGRDAHATAANVAAIRAQIEETESTLKADQAQLGYTRIFAPMSGTVVSVDAHEGQTINATYSAPQLLRIADLSTLTVWTQVSEADVTQLHAGMPLYFTTLGYGDRRWTGRLRQILPVPPKPAGTNGADDASTSPVAAQPGASNVVLYTALFDIPNPKGELRPDMSAQVFFVTAAAHNTVTVPMTALAPKDTDKGLYTARVVVGRTVEQRRVRVGVHDRFTAQVLDGLVLGDVVVTGAKPDTERPSLLGFRF